MSGQLDLAAGIAVSRILIGYGMIVWALEYLRLAEHFGRGRVLSWDVGQLRYLWSSRGRFERLTAGPFGAKGAVAMLWLRLALGLLLLVPAMDPAYYSACFALATATSVVWFVRAPQGQDGSDQMFLVLTASLALAFAVDSRNAYEYCGWFVCAQLTLCYLTAGIAKLRSREWRSGDAILLVFRTHTYGSRIVHRAAKGHRSIPVALAWAVIGFETAFPLIFLLPSPWAELALAVPLSFHLATAMFMGLNLFFVSFLAAYPFMVVLLQQEPFYRLLDGLKA